MAVQIFDRTYAAVALPRGTGWERIALFDCWCKYDMDHALEEFLEIRMAPAEPNVQHFELVLRASGGGTGIYTQDEAHFRVYRGSVRRVISFVSRKLSCPMAPVRPCQFERRWFSHGVLVETRGSYDSERVPRMLLSEVTELEIRYATAPKCSAYKWVEERFRYERSGTAAACKPYTLEGPAH